MKHRGKAKSFGRKTDQRRAFFKSLVTSLVEKRRIHTTEARAKALRPMIEKLITKAKVGTLQKRRELISATSEKTAKILIDKIAPQYKERQGGYTRVMKLGVRRSDAADLAIIEFV
jgi:large subunit ribosomal protein L17